MMSSEDGPSGFKDLDELLRWLKEKFEQIVAEDEGSIRHDDDKEEYLFATFFSPIEEDIDHEYEDAFQRYYEEMVARELFLEMASRYSCCHHFHFSTN